MLRTPLVLTLALATRGGLADPTPATPAAARSGRVSGVVGNDGTLLAETERGPVLLIVAWDATIWGRHGPLHLVDVRVGDRVEWSGANGQSVAMVDHLTVLPDGAR